MTYKPDSAVTWIVVHYSATPIERDYTSKDIDDMHRRRGFKEIGYHYFIRKDGTVETGRDLSQPGRFEMGAHSKGENGASIGVCFEGGVTEANPNLGFDTRTHAQKVAMEALILTLLDRFPGAVVEGHRDMPGAATQCPGFDARQWWSDVVRRRAEYVAPVPPIAAPTEPTSEGRAHPIQSTTIWAQIKQWLVTAAPVGYSAWTALGESDPTTRYIILGVLGAITVYIVHLGRHIISERLKKWARGDR